MQVLETEQGLGRKQVYIHLKPNSEAQLKGQKLEKALTSQRYVKGPLC